MAYLTSRRWSLLESLANVLVGFIVVPIVWLTIITPLLDLRLTLRENVGVILILAVASIARSYTLRRFFNWIRKSPTI